MAKKETPYKTEQAVLELDSAALESASEKILKATIEKLKITFSEKRKERIDNMKNFVVAYRNVGEYRVSLMAMVKAGEVTPDNAVNLLKTFVASGKLLDDSE